MGRGIVKGERWEPKHWARTRIRILSRDGYVCGICGRDGANSVDHIVPRIRGGSHNDDNLRAAHAICNSQLGGRTRRKMSVVRADTTRWPSPGRFF